MWFVPHSPHSCVCVQDKLQEALKLHVGVGPVPIAVNDPVPHLPAPCLAIYEIKRWI